jgi:predicted nucleic acid-binding protein
MRVVANAGPIIWLAKIGRLDLLEKLYGEVSIPKEVYVESVQKGLEHGFRDALIIKEASDKGWIKIVELNEAQSTVRDRITHQLKELEAGEIEAIVYAKDTGADLILLDDSTARSFAESWGLETKGTLFILLKALKINLLDVKGTRGLIYELVERGFRIDPRLFAKLVKRLEK